ncbi:HlyD family secretion protein [Thermotomaculum hydrothermale]|uniref:HlyD family secretion protein n=1 Tax=Thermotomaculum hydrothermale TaxID=981385 RepID=A0A7R6PLX1_9BACT|nr:efflux RND transporter periplasmic adaptor subunit [Thermotomaculum hydrothermale]BBB32512.1 HlyD family secretion protein [Thermotomaculum hydrothermale]
MKKYLIIAGVIILFVIAGVLKNRDNGKFVKVKKVEKKDISETISGTGTVKPVKTVTVMSEIMGKIVELPVKEGDFVKKGDLLCRIDDKNYKSEVSRLKAELKKQKLVLEQLKIDLKQSEKDFKRKLKLFKSGILSKEEFENAKNQFESKKLNVSQQEFYIKQANANLAKALENLSKTKIVAPIDGKVTSLRKEVGEQVIQGTINNPGSIIMVLSDMNKLELEVDVNEVDSVLLKKGMEADIHLDAFDNKVFKGIVKQISESAEKPAGRDVSLFKVKIDFEEINPKIKPGMSGRAEIKVRESKNALIIPIEAVRKEESGKEYCFKVKNKIAKKTYIKTGISNDFYVEVKEGLSENDTVVTGPYRVLKTLKNGDKINFKNE